VKKLADYSARCARWFFCTKRLQLVKGAARARRRFLDLLSRKPQPVICRCSSVHAHRSPRKRVAQTEFRRRGRLDSFSQELVKLGNEIIRARANWRRISPLARLA